MMLEKSFEVIRNEKEHKGNCLHCEIKMWYNYYISKGVPKEMAIRYAKWNYENVLLPMLEEEKRKDER